MVLDYAIKKGIVTVNVAKGIKRLPKSTKDIGEVYKPYCFRHTLCTNLILNGTPLPVVQRIMGDNSTDVIVKSYTHIKTEDMAASLGRLHAGMTDGE